MSHERVPAPGGAEVPAPPWAARRSRRARRAARPPLDRDQIVTAALRIVDDEGVEALSLRRLADALGVTPMSIYWHVRDKAELLELVGQSVLAEIEIPPATGDWRQQLTDLHRAMLAGLLKHPNALDVLIGRARYGAAGVTMFERLLTILLGAGLSPEAAFDAYMILYEYLLGFAAVANRTPEFRDMQQQGVLYLLSLSADRFPSIARVAPVIGSRSLEEQFEMGLAALIDGIAETLLPRAV
jgi:TetR/AcrR family tetracycline transcriptional repressor